MNHRERKLKRIAQAREKRMHSNGPNRLHLPNDVPRNFQVSLEQHGGTNSNTVPFMVPDPATGGLKLITVGGIHPLVEIASRFMAADIASPDAWASTDEANQRLATLAIKRAQVLFKAAGDVLNPIHDATLPVSGSE